MSGRRLRLFGHVQGVYFRAWTLEQAQLLRVKGWVRNRRDGSVEIEAFGPEPALEALTALCRSGPAQARVERMTEEEVEGEAPAGFRAERTF